MSPSSRVQWPLRAGQTPPSRAQFLACRMPASRSFKLVAEHSHKECHVLVVDELRHRPRRKPIEIIDERGRLRPQCIPKFSVRS